MLLLWRQPQAKRNWQRETGNCLSCTRLEKHSTNRLGNIPAGVIKIVGQPSVIGSKAAVLCRFREAWQFTDSFNRTASEP
jgi:hypothetical protein